MVCKSLYVHIPFCATRCDYCDFFSSDVTLYSEHKGVIPDYYIDALLNEVRFYVYRYQIDCFKTIYIGGGTPSLLTAEQLQKLITGLLHSVKKDSLLQVQEITVEMNPESVTKQKLLVLQNTGVTRLSLGIQSLFDGALKAVNRHCTATIAKKTLELVKDVWQKELNLDCIAGLPCQNEKEFCSSLQEICSYKPQHVSLYTLTVEEGTSLYTKIQNGMEWDINEADNQWLLGRDILLQKGYEQYEVSNFAQKGFESLHNMTYWQQEDYIGIGSGAAGTVYDFSGKSTGLRWTNTYNIESYCNFWNCQNLSELKTTAFIDSSFTNPLKEFELSIPREVEELSLQTQEFEFFMMGLRTLKGVSSKCYKERFYSVSPWFGDIQKRLNGANGAWQKLVAKGQCTQYLAQDNSVWYAPTDKGILFLNSILGYLT